ncbi:MAG: helix-turn-helix transcriptional regulator [Deltaproteobacteria bacterium]|nr:helix-turn-helix transcriptional regulator [Deltaproteobacteria bacterium]MBN2687255.1 helix-turn-helix transcriptional regulator [Deltaproteobacteria bacterium]
MKERDVMNHESTAQGGHRFPFPSSPVLMAALRALYAGGPKSRWESDFYGHPRYRYEARDGTITFFFRPPPDFGNRFHVSKALYYTPRLAFIYSGSLRAAVHELSVETADVFLILMSQIARLRDPTRDIARISMGEIADFRGVHVRHGSAGNLYEVFKKEIQRLADLCLTMTWKDYTTGRAVAVGKETPDRLLDIVDVEYKHGKDAWTSFSFRCGLALSHFLSPEGLRWIGYYSRSLLNLSPYHEALTKKLGTYWTLVGIISGKKGSQPRATPCTILDFCGEAINWRNPGQTVDSFFKAHDRLIDIGVLEASDLPEPLDRRKGYFRRWLETPMTVRLSNELWRVQEPKQVPQGKKKQSSRNIRPYHAGGVAIPEKARDIMANPPLIRQFRSDYFMRQGELARALGVKRQTLSRYERGLKAIPEDTAAELIRIIRQRKDEE